MVELFAEIAIFSALDKTLHYRLAPDSCAAVRVGMRVLVPLGAHEALGLVVALSETVPEHVPQAALRPLHAVLDSSPVIPPELIDLCRWISQYYFYPLGEVLQSALPSGIQSKPKTCFRLTPAGREALGAEKGCKLSDLFADFPQISLAQAGDTPGARKKRREELEDFERKGFVERFFEWETPRVTPRKIKMVRLVSPPASDQVEKNENLRHLIALLDGSGGILPAQSLHASVKNGRYWVNKLLKEGILATDEEEEVRESRCGQSFFVASPPALTSDQTAVLDALRPGVLAPRFEPFLLFGVTGSGKTEIYLRLVERVLEQGRGALILVPEIALSTQMETLFRHRFGAQLAIWHSSLSAGARYDQWREVLSGRRRVVLGVRSAVFMPVRDLGLILVDEEHDASYKQDDHLRYHARDVALMRASRLRIPIVLGSATPSLQSLYHSRAGRYTLLSLPRRIFDRPLPDLHIVNMSRQSRRNRILSVELQKALSETVETGNQALLFLNRRGFATFYLCNACAHVLQCSNCSVSLTYHQKDHRLRCHYCGWERSIPERCPACNHTTLIPHGFGTERVEQEVKQLLPHAHVARIDRDTVNPSQKIAEYLNAVRRGQIDVLIGTQMIAKGHDFPNVTLVGIINADTALQLPDFRAGETTVQLLIQVAGRAGRGEKPGRVLVQTYNPSHYTIGSVVRMDYLGFCDKELESREQLQYPPFARLLKFLVTAAREDVTEQAARELAALSRGLAETFRSRSQYIAVLGPSPAPLVKLKNSYRWHLFVKAWSSQDLQHFTEEVLMQSRTSPLLRRVRLAVDRDPMSTL